MSRGLRSLAFGRGESPADEPHLNNQSLEKEINPMFDFSNYPDIAPAELRELMQEMDQSEPELDLEELTEWLEKQYA
jgi:hypothetical protein